MYLFIYVNSYVCVLYFIVILFMFHFDFFYFNRLLPVFLPFFNPFIIILIPFIITLRWVWLLQIIFNLFFYLNILFFSSNKQRLIVDIEHGNGLNCRVCVCGHE